MQCSLIDSGVCIQVIAVKKQLTLQQRGMCPLDSCVYQLLLPVDCGSSSRPFLSGSLYLEEAGITFSFCCSASLSGSRGCFTIRTVATFPLPEAVAELL